MHLLKCLRFPCAQHTHTMLHKATDAWPVGWIYRQLRACEGVSVCVCVWGPLAQFFSVSYTQVLANLLIGAVLYIKLL